MAVAEVITTIATIAPDMFDLANLIFLPSVRHCNSPAPIFQTMVWSWLEDTPKMLSRNQPDRIHVAFDDHRPAANAECILPVTLAHHLRLGELVNCHVDLGQVVPTRATRC